MAKNPVPVPVAPAPSAPRPKHPRRSRRRVQVVLAAVLVPVFVHARAEADNVFAERIGQGRTAKAEKELQADVLTAQYRGLAEDAHARAEALAAHGSGSVRAALVDRLAGIQFEIVPYSRDPTPQRIEYEQPSSTP